ncbi:uncharacterized protein G2W53_022440 [Senna tora]|uniref:Uncharacterized protein n=1 Tax=Senna tora TaxID=362788 RepID=A0A834TNQ3_9FABA|nr:uncharacterized protein G2W53_022440 [Senna tora]
MELVVSIDCVRYNFKHGNGITMGDPNPNVDGFANPHSLELSLKLSSVRSLLPSLITLPSSIVHLLQRRKNQALKEMGVRSLFSVFQQLDVIFHGGGGATCA